MKKIILIISFLLINVLCFSQVGFGTLTPDESAILDLSSSSKGLLLSRINSTQRNAPNGILSPTGGILIFDTSTNCPLVSLETGLWINVCNGDEFSTTTGITTSIGNVGINTLTPDNNTILDIVSTSKGVLLPKSSTDLANVTGLMYYNTTNNTVRIYNGTSWITLITN